MVWKDKPSFLYIQKRARSYLEADATHETFEVITADGSTLKVAVPSIELSEKGMNQISEAYPNHEKMVRALRLVLMKYDEMSQLSNEDLMAIESDYSVKFAPDILDDAFMIDKFEDFTT